MCQLLLEYIMEGFEHKLEFNAFLLSLGKELGASGFEQLKFLLRDCVPLGKSECLKEIGRASCRERG